MSTSQTARGTADLEKFTDMIEKLLNIAWGDDWGTFSEEFPTGSDPESTPLPHITYQLKSRKIANNRGLKGQTFGSFPDPDHEGESISTKRTWYECKVEFTVYGKTNKETRQLSQRFEDFMETYIGYFKDEGISEILFETEERPEINGYYRQDLPNRTLTYLVIVERILEIRTFDLRRVDAVINAVEVDVRVQEDLYEADYTEENTGVTAKLGTSNFLDLYDKNFPKLKEEN